MSSCIASLSFIVEDIIPVTFAFIVIDFFFREVPHHQTENMPGVEVAPQK